MGQKARDVGCSLLAAGCAPDHVHVVARLASTTTVADLVCRMKGGGAHDALRSLGRRETKHDATRPAERWQQATQTALDTRGRNLDGS
jgi:REP element-mobilizing transposase RayT